MQATKHDFSAADDLGKLVLRVILAVLLFHGVSKRIGGIGFVAGMLEKAGPPSA